MNLRYYQDFVEAVKTIYNAPDELRMSRYKTEGLKIGEMFVGKDKESIETALSLAKPFDVDNDIKKLLLMTTPPKSAELLRLPFPAIFIDIGIDKTDAELDETDDSISGLLVIERKVVDPDGKPIGRTFHVIHRTDTKEQDDPDYQRIYVDETIFSVEGDKLRFNYERSKTSKVLQQFVYNFVLFLNQPEVKIVEVTRSAKTNEKRESEGKIRLPELTKVVKITGVLKEYVDSLSKGGHFSYSHKFWVRGHWRMLRNPERYGEKAGTRTWIPPYVKGKGMLIDKSYRVLKERADDV